MNKKINFIFFFFLIFKGSYQIIYRNVFHAAIIIAKTESIFALQKGEQTLYSQ